MRSHLVAMRYSRSRSLKDIKTSKSLSLISSQNEITYFLYPKENRKKKFDGREIVREDRFIQRNKSQSPGRVREGNFGRRGV